VINCLIVDDSPVTRRTIERCARAAGVKVGEIFQADDGVEAIEILECRKIDCVLTDMNMPHMNGLELSKAVGRLGAAAPAVVLITTDRAEDARVRESLAAGAAFHLKKPFTQDQLKKVFSQLFAVTA
jgi:two-component system chemotaxis response regulator CheY